MGIGVIFGWFVFGLLLVGSVSAVNISVCAIGCNATTITGALALSVEGDTLLVGSGIYSENVNITFAISLLGNGTSETKIVAADSTWPALNISTNNVLLTNLTVNTTGSISLGTNGSSLSLLDFSLEGGEDYGAYMYGVLNTIVQNSVSSGIVNTSFHVVFADNVTMNNVTSWGQFRPIQIHNSNKSNLMNSTLVAGNLSSSVAVHISSSSNIEIINNTVNNSQFGTYVGAGSYNITIARNTFTLNDDTVYLTQTWPPAFSNVVIIENTIMQSPGAGIHLGDLSGQGLHLVENNTFFQVGVAIDIATANGNMTLRNNQITAVTGLRAQGLYYSPNSIIGNNFTISGVGFNLSGNLRESIIANNTVNGNGLSLHSINGLNATIFNNLFNTSTLFLLPNASAFFYWNTSVFQTSNIVGGPNTSGNFYSLPDETGFSDYCSTRLTGDGLCRATYTINNSNIDYHPLARLTASTIIRVCSSYCDSITIGSGIALAISADTLHIGSGTYTENLNLTIPLSIIGNGSAETNLIAADNTTYAINISSHNVRLENFTLNFSDGDGIFSNTTSSILKNINLIGSRRGYAYANTGIFLWRALDAIVQNVNLAGGSVAAGQVRWGIQSTSSHNVRIDNFTITQTTTSISTTSTNVSIGNSSFPDGFTNDAVVWLSGLKTGFIENNYFYGTSNQKIFLSSSNQVTIRNNTFASASGTPATHLLVMLSAVENSSITNNTFLSETYSRSAGLTLYLTSSGTSVENNTFLNTSVGLNFSSDGKSVISRNFFFDNNISIAAVNYSNVGAAINFTNNTLEVNASGNYALLLSGNLTGSLIANNTIAGNTSLLYSVDGFGATFTNNLFNITSLGILTNSTPSFYWNTSVYQIPNIVGGPNSSGNYYATPNGSGFSDYCSVYSSGDGLCRASYTLSNSNLDYHPLARLTASPIIRVCSSNCDSTTISGALLQSINGDRISVDIGNYTENLNITTSVSIVGNTSRSSSVTLIAVDNTTYAINISANNVRLENLSINASDGDGVFSNSSDSLLRNLNLLGSRRGYAYANTGVFLWRTSGASLQNVDIAGGSVAAGQMRWGIQSTSSHNLVIHNLTITQTTTSISTTSTNVSIGNSSFPDGFTNDAVVLLSGASGGFIENNYFYGTSNGKISLTSSNRMTLRNNSFISSSGSPATHLLLWLSFVENSSIANNTFLSEAYSRSAGLSLYISSSGNYIENNTFLNLSVGLNFSSDGKSKVSRNFFFNNNLSFAQVNYSSTGAAINFTNNTLEVNASGDYAFLFLGNLTGSLIANNTVVGNSSLIYSLNGFGATFINNLFNITAIGVLNSSAGLFYWNTSLFQVTNIVGGPNSSGNYYANSSGIGFSDYCSVRFAGDGLCRMDYTLDGSNIDYQPLAKLTASQGLSVCSSGCDSTTITGALTAAFADDILRIGSGTYTENLNLTIPLSIIGNGSAETNLIAADNTTYAINISSHNVRLENFTLNFSDGDGIFSNTTSSILKNINLIGSRRGYAYANTGIFLWRTLDAIVQNVNLAGGSVAAGQVRWGIQSTSSHNLMIHNLTITQTTTSISTTSTNVSIGNSSFPDGFNNDAVVFVSGASGGFIENNYFYGTSNQKISLTSSNQMTLRNNSFISVSGSPATHLLVWLSFVENSTISNNSFLSEAYSRSAGLSLYISSSGNYIENNTFLNLSVGLNFSSDGKSKVSRNFFFNNNLSFAQVNYSSTGAAINFTNNTLEVNASGDYAFLFLGNLTGSLIANNTIAGNTSLLYSVDGFGATFTNNLFNITSLGILTNSTPSFYWNTSVYQIPNIVGGPNSSGNYYATPNGSGFSDTCGILHAGENICKRNYTLNGSNVDFYPLARLTAIPSITVCPSDCDASSISGGVSIAYDGETIQVGSGNYTENVNVTRPLMILGNGIYETRITAADNTSPTLNVSGNNVLLANLTINTSGNINFASNGSSTTLFNLSLEGGRQYGAYLFSAQNFLIRQSVSQGIVNTSYHVLSSSNFTFDNVSILNSSRFGIYFVHSNNSQIVNSTFHRYNGTAVAVAEDFSNNILIEGNVFNHSRTGLWIPEEASFANNITIKQNIFDNLVYGIYSGILQNSVFSGNNFFGNLTEIAIESDDENITNVLVENNTFNIKGIALHLDKSGNVTYRYNNFSISSGGEAIRLGSVVSSNLIVNNSINLNSGAIGLRLMENQFYTIIANNTLTGNGTAISASNAANATIFNNLFNATSLFSLPNSDLFFYWNTSAHQIQNIVGGPSSGGNYYGNSSNTAFSDICEVPTAGAGICDTDYNINSLNIDYVPLAKLTAEVISSEQNNGGGGGGAGGGINRGTSGGSAANSATKSYAWSTISSGETKGFNIITKQFPFTRFEFTAKQDLKDAKVQLISVNSLPDDVPAVPGDVRSYVDIITNMLPSQFGNMKLESSFRTEEVKGKTIEIYHYHRSWERVPTKCTTDFEMTYCSSSPPSLSLFAVVFTAANTPTAMVISSPQKIEQPTSSVTQQTSTRDEVSQMQNIQGIQNITVSQVREPTSNESLPFVVWFIPTFLLVLIGGAIILQRRHSHSQYRDLKQLLLVDGVPQTHVDAVISYLMKVKALHMSEPMLRTSLASAQYSPKLIEDLVRSFRKMDVHPMPLSVKEELQGILKAGGVHPGQLDAIMEYLVQMKRLGIAEEQLRAKLLSAGYTTKLVGDILIQYRRI